MKRFKKILKFAAIELIYIGILFILFRSGLASKILDYIFIIY